MNFELTVAESFDSSWSLLQSLHINFLTSNSCECPHRLLDLIVKERDSLSCRGMRILRFPDSESSTFYCLAPGRFSPADTAWRLLQRVSALPCQRGGIIGRPLGMASEFAEKTQKNQHSDSLPFLSQAMHKLIHIQPRRNRDLQH